VPVGPQQSLLGRGGARREGKKRDGEEGKDTLMKENDEKNYDPSDNP